MGGNEIKGLGGGEGIQRRGEEKRKKKKAKKKGEKGKRRGERKKRKRKKKKSMWDPNHNTLTYQIYHCNSLTTQNAMFHGFH